MTYDLVLSYSFRFRQLMHLQSSLQYPDNLKQVQYILKQLDLVHLHPTMIYNSVSFILIP